MRKLVVEIALDFDSQWLRTKANPKKGSLFPPKLPGTEGWLVDHILNFLSVVHPLPCTCIDTLHYN